MNEEILRIQKMVAEGKVTPEDSVELLESVGLGASQGTPAAGAAVPLGARIAAWTSLGLLVAAVMFVALAVAFEHNCRRAPIYSTHRKTVVTEPGTSHLQETSASFSLKDVYYIGLCVSIPLSVISALASWGLGRFAFARLRDLPERPRPLEYYVAGFAPGLCSLAALVYLTGIPGGIAIDAIERHTREPVMLYGGFSAAWGLTIALLVLLARRFPRLVKVPFAPLFDWWHPGRGGPDRADEDKLKG